MPRTRPEVLSGDNAADRMRTLARDCSRNQAEGKAVYCVVYHDPGTKQSFMAEVDKFMLKPNVNYEVMVASISTRRIDDGVSESWEVPIDDDLMVIAGQEMHIIKSSALPFGHRILFGDRNL